MAEPDWTDVGSGFLGVTLLGADGHPVTLLKETWDSKSAKHTNLEINWSAFVDTVERADGVFESRRLPTNKIYVKSHPSIVREDGRVGSGVLIVVVSRQLDRVVSTYVPDVMFGKLGKRLWP